MSIRTDYASRPPRPRATELPFVLRPKVVLVAVVVVLLAWLGWASYSAWRAQRASLRIVEQDDAPVAVVSVEVFAADDHGAAPSPTDRIAVLDLEGGELDLGPEFLRSGEALLRVSSPAHGISYAHVEAGRSGRRLVLGGKTSVRGRVTFSPTDPAASPIPGAVVQAFGGGPRGVLLAETSTSPEGTFVFEAISDTVRWVTFRVLAPGFAVFEREVPTGSNPEPFVLTSTGAVRGTVLGPPELSVDGLELRVFHVPGVTARTRAGGSFVLDHLPPSPTRCALIVPALPPGLTHARCEVLAGSDAVHVLVEPEARLRGFVVDSATELPVAGVKVYHEHGPAGVEVVDCDDGGRFDIGRVPAGRVRVHADVLVERLRTSRAGQGRWQKVHRQGWLDVTVGPGERVDGLVIELLPPK